MENKLTCPTCGCPVQVASSDEGTNYYVPQLQHALPTDAEIDAMFPFLDNNSERQRIRVINKRKGAKALRDRMEGRG